MTAAEARTSRGNWCALPRGAVLASARFLGRHFEHIFGRIQKIGMSAVSSCGTMGYPDVSDLYNNYARWRRREREREMYLIGRPCVLGRSPHVESPRRCDPNLGPSGPKALTVFKNFSACGAARCTVGPSGPKAPVVLKKFSACGAARCTVGPSGPKAQVVFKIFSACGAAGGTLGPSGPKAPVLFKFSPPAALKEGLCSTSDISTTEQLIACCFDAQTVGTGSCRLYRVGART